MEENYRCYFNIDKSYFPVITERIMEENEDMWKKFYPHKTFENLLRDTIGMLDKKTRVSLWVEGPYGTGKSHAVLTLKKMLLASNEDIEEYFEDYKDAWEEKDLCQQFLSARRGKLVVASRDSSSEIDGDAELAFAVQDAISGALEKQGYNTNTSSLREVIIQRLGSDKNLHDFMNNYITGEYKELFDDENVDDVIEKLKTYKSGSKELQTLIKKFTTIAKDKGVNVFRLTIDDLQKWIEEVIKENELDNLVLIWDEFTEFFSKNAKSLSGFQKLAQISESLPFYFIIVTHNVQNTFDNMGKGTDQRKIVDRFKKPICKVELPDGIAFKLIANALKLEETGKEEWERVKKSLINRTERVRAKVRDVVKGLEEEDLESVLPIQPYTAVFLKYMATTFDSNQRSMFDFIANTQDDDVKGFLWYIEHNGVNDTIEGNMCLLTVDCLWDFFCKKAIDKGSSTLRVVMEKYNSAVRSLELNNQPPLTTNQERILKTIAIMQSMSSAGGSGEEGIEFFTPSETNIIDAYEGTSLISSTIRPILNELVGKNLIQRRGNASNILYRFPEYGQNAEEEVEKIKKQIISNFSMNSLVDLKEYLSEYMKLTDYLNLRYETEGVTWSDLGRKVTNTKNAGSEPDSWKIKVFFAFAKDDNEGSLITQKIKEFAQSAEQEKFYCVIVDATQVPFGSKRLDDYAKYTAWAQYQQGKDGEDCRRNQAQANKVIEEWFNLITNDDFGVYRVFDGGGSECQKVKGFYPLCHTLEIIDKTRYTECLEGLGNFTQGMWASNNLPSGVEQGVKSEAKGVYLKVQGVLGSAWNTTSGQKYWEDFPQEVISKLKIRVDEIIKEGFETPERQIEIYDLYQKLQTPPFGLMPCNLSAYVMGFVLREYVGGTYKYSDGITTTALDTDKLKSMVDKAIKKQQNPSTRYDRTYIVLRSDNEKAFDEGSAFIFGFDPSRATSSTNTQNFICAKMQEYRLPLFCLKSLDEAIYEGGKADFLEVVDLYTQLLSDNGGASGNAIIDKIGKKFVINEKLPQLFKTLLTQENLANGMKEYLKTFEGGELIALSQKIEDGGAYINVIKDEFSGDANWLWKSETIDNAIRSVITQYKIIDLSNTVLGANRSYKSVIDGWKSTTQFIKIAFDAVKGSVSDGLYTLLGFLHKIATNESFEKKDFLLSLEASIEEFRAFNSNQKETFKKVCSYQLSAVAGDEDINGIMDKIPTDSFKSSKAQYIETTNKVIDNFIKEKETTKLKKFWSDETRTTSPYEWSQGNKMPILCMVKNEDGDIKEVKKTFDTICEVCNGKSVGDGDVKTAYKALGTLKEKGFFEKLKSQSAKDEAFYEYFLTPYSALVSEKDVPKVKDKMSSMLILDKYDWFDSMDAQKCVKDYVKNLYDSGGYEGPRKIINDMDTSEVKNYLMDLVKDNMDIGIAIIKRGR